MKVRSIARKEAKIDESKIANEKRTLCIDEKDYEVLKKIVKGIEISEGAPSTALNTTSQPEEMDNGGLFWNSESILPPILEEYKRMIRGMFSNIKDSDVKGYNISVYPPSVIKMVTSIPKTENDIMCRIIMVLGSPEILFAETLQGKMEATCNIFMSRDQAVMLPYGICNTVSLSYNNNNNYTFKMPKSTRGICRNKFPDKRWIILFDFISDESCLARELKSAMKTAKETKKTTTVGEDIVLEKAKNIIQSKEVNEILPDQEKV